MDTINVICPKCHHHNSIATPSRAGGHVMCVECSHVFKVVPRIRTGKIPRSASEAHTQATPPNADAIMSALSSMLTNTNQQTERPIAAPAAQSAPPLGNPSINTLLNQPSTSAAITAVHTAPAADITPALIETTAFNPAVSAIPPADASVGNTVNNLVFTLLPAQDTPRIQADVPLLLNDTIEKTEAISANQQRLHEQQTRLHKEFNWTLASLVALTVLIIQLFYLMAVK